MMLVLFLGMVMIMGNDDFHPGGHNQGGVVVENILSSYEASSQVCKKERIPKNILDKSDKNASKAYNLSHHHLNF